MPTMDSHRLTLTDNRAIHIEIDRYPRFFSMLLPPPNSKRQMPVRRNPQVTDPIKSASLSAIQFVLDPLLDLMFEVGISVQEFNSLIRERAVQIADKRLKRAGIRSSKSRVAIITGLPRSEVTKLSKQNGVRKGENFGQQPARRILMAWFSDPKFLEASGQPAVLPIFGKHRSFERLVSKYGAGSPVRAMLDELTQIGAVERLANQHVSARTRVPISVGFTPNAIEAAGERCKDLLGTLISNLRRSQRPMFEATSLINDANPTMLPVVRREIGKQGESLINSTSAILKRSRYKGNKTQPRSKGCRIGVTVFYFEESTEDDATKPGGGPEHRRRNLRRQ